MRRLMLTTAIMTACAAAQAEESRNIIRLEQVTVLGNNLFHVEPTQGTDSYRTDAATVGTKVPASVRDIPQSVSVVTQQASQDRGADTLDQLAAKLPGLRVMPNDDGRSSIHARGYKYSEYNVDGLPAQMESRTGTAPNLAAFDRVEIMRGPSGLFDSSGEMGGIINLVRKRGTEEFAGSLSVGAGSLKRYEAQADIGGPLTADGKLRGRVVLDALGKSPKASDHNNHHETLYGALDYDFGSGVHAGIGYLYQRRNIKPDNGLPLGADGKLLPLPNSDYYGADWNTFKMDSHDMFADVSKYFTDGGVAKLGMRYSHRDVDWNYIYGGSALDSNNMLTAAGFAGAIKQSSFAMDGSYSNTFTTWGNVSEYVVGADHRYFSDDGSRAALPLGRIAASDFNSYPYVDIASRATAANRMTQNHTKLSSVGVYGKVTLRPIQDLALIGGGRLGHWEVKNHNLISGKTATDKQSARLTGYLGTVYDIDRNHSVYASYSSLFVPQTLANINGDLLGPRKGNQVEAGIKGSYKNDRLQTRLSAYRLTDKNAGVAVAGMRNVYTALGKRRVTGLEAEISGEITDDLSVVAGYNYMDTKIINAGSSDDQFFLLMPRHSGSIWTKYRINPQWQIGAGVNAMSGFYSTAGITTGGYATVDAMAAYQWNNLSIQFNVDNLLGRDYYARVGTAGTFNMPGEGRTVMARLRYQF